MSQPKEKHPEIGCLGILGMILGFLLLAFAVMAGGGLFSLVVGGIGAGIIVVGLVVLCVALFTGNLTLFG